MKGHLYLIILISVAMLAVAGCGANAEQPPTSSEIEGSIIVFAAASLNDAFTEIGTAFTAANPQSEVVFNFGGSSQLAAQLIEGAPGDVFASANEAQMARVVEGGLIDSEAVAIFATNDLVVIVPADNPADVQALEDLNKPGLLLILALPGVPIRQYTDEIVTALGEEFQAGFYANVVSEEENVRLVAAKIALGEADAALVYRSDVTPDQADRVLIVPIPAEQNIVATYPIAPLNTGNNPSTAAAFIAFVCSAEGQAILSKWGLSPAP